MYSLAHSIVRRNSAISSSASAITDCQVAFDEASCRRDPGPSSVGSRCFALLPLSFLTFPPTWNFDVVIPNSESRIAWVGQKEGQTAQGADADILE